uniref:E3 ubiquitin/ISG15 ligase TRIM25-like n=1 Tax=Myxine glutinosa TaxID=7769 RepID=UPI00358E3A93
MASSSINIGVSTDELTCTVCLDLLTEPVTLACGHSFCHLCVEKYWETGKQVRTFSCPNCREVFPQKPKLKKNVMLARLVEQVKMRQRELGSKVDAQESGIHCELCKREAVKLCVPCQILCCEKHVKPHQQERHKLVEPGKAVGELRCSEHENAIQLYCIDDGKLMCLMCMDGQHQDHKVVAVKIAHTELKGILSANCPQVSNSKQHVESQLHQLQKEVIDTQHVGKGTNDRLEAKRRTLYQYVDEAVDLMKRRVDKMQKRKLFLLEKQIEKMQQNMEYLRKVESSLQTALQELETISFLGGFQDLVKRIQFVLDFQHKSTRGWDFSVAWRAPLDFPVALRAPLRSFGCVTVAVIRAGFWFGLDIVLTIAGADRLGLDAGIETLGNVLLFAHLEHNGRLPRLDANSAHPLILISEDLRTATLTRTVQQYPEHPDRFDFWVQVLSSESFSSGRHYWEVDLSSCRRCRVGVALNSMGRKGGESRESHRGMTMGWDIMEVMDVSRNSSQLGASSLYQEEKGKNCRLGENPESLCVEKNNHGYSAWHNNQCTALSVKVTPKRLGFFLDCEEGEMRCFWDLRVLHVFKGNFKEPVKPAIGFFLDSGVGGLMCFGDAQHGRPTNVPMYQCTNVPMYQTPFKICVHDIR